MRRILTCTGRTQLIAELEKKIEEKKLGANGAVPQLASDKTALPTKADSSEPWMPAPGELLVISSRFHPGSSRGVVVCRIEDPSQHWLVDASDLSRAVFPSSTYRFKSGDVVRLHPAATASAAKCLGEPGNKSSKSGVVLFAGTTCKGIQRNIEVASIQTGCVNQGPVVAVSLYSSVDLMPQTRCAFTGTPSKREAEALVESLAALAETAKLPWKAKPLVDLFGLAVWERVWALFAESGSYLPAFEAFCSFQTERWRALQALGEPYQELLECRRLLEPARCSAFAAAVETASCEEECARRMMVGSCAASWSCGTCLSGGNPATRKACRVCASTMPTFKCTRCLQAQPIINDTCRNCLLPNPSKSCTPPSTLPSTSPPARPTRECERFTDSAVVSNTFVFMDDVSVHVGRVGCKTQAATAGDSAATVAPRPMPPTRSFSSAAAFRSNPTASWQARSGVCLQQLRRRPKTVKTAINLDAAGRRRRGGRGAKERQEHDSTGASSPGRALPPATATSPLRQRP